jgi:hypothetical protein
MATIPIFNDELATSVEAIMVFPNDLNNAQAYACWLVLRAVKEPAGQKRSHDAMVVAELGEHARRHKVKEGERAREAGYVTGHLIKTLRALVRMDRTNASMNMAIRAVESQGAWNRERGIERCVGMSSLTDNLREFRKVLHLWGTWPMFDLAGKLACDTPDAGYCSKIDVHRFLAESERLLHELQLWSAEDKLLRPYLAGNDFYHPPPSWNPPEPRCIETEKAAPSRAVEAAEKRKAPSKARGGNKPTAPVKRRSPRKG